MTDPAIAERDVTVYCGHARDVLPKLAAGSVNCVVTSPPYYGLRDYGTGTWVGGDPGCEHKPWKDPTRNIATSGLEGGKDTVGHQKEGYKGNTCPRCGAERVDHQLGLEASPGEYVAALVAVFAEVRRVLAADGVLWLNLGDSYSRGKGTFTDGPQQSRNGNGVCGPRGLHPSAARAVGTKTYADVPPEKNLLGIPWRVAFALQDDGWILRNAVIWHKPNAMPESVTDRLSTRYEHVFLFSKSRRYWFDLDAIREPLAYPDAADGSRVFGGVNKASELTTGSSTRRTGNVYGKAATPPGVIAHSFHSGTRHDESNSSGRNPGDVWTIPTSPYPGAHFATMPAALARRCILAGCPEAGTVLDPFAGSGTTLKVARQLGRNSVGVELNPDYLPLIRDRIGQDTLDFGGISSCQNLY